MPDLSRINNQIHREIMEAATPSPITSGEALNMYQMDEAINLLNNVAVIAINALDIAGKPKTGDMLNMAVKGIEAACRATASAASAPVAQSERDALLDAALTWWDWHRPLTYSLADHIANPAVNTSGKASANLAIAIAAIAAQQPAEGGKAQG